MSKSRLYEHVLSVSGELLSFVDADYTYRVVNDCFLHAFKRARADTVGRRVSDVLGERVFELDVKPRLDRCLSGETVDFQLCLELPGAGNRRLDVRYEPILERDECVGVAIRERDVTGPMQLRADLHDARAQLREQAHRLRTVRTEEREFIAREIHDELGQALTGLKIDASWLAERLPPRDKALRAHAGSLLGLIDEIIHTVQSIPSSLTPALVEDLGLPSAIECLTQQFGVRLGLECGLQVADDFPRQMDASKAIAVFRILQEALTNICRHARANRVAITLAAQDDECVLEVTDNGVGITEETMKGSNSIGVRGMRERAVALGGNLTIERRDEGGTLVTLRIPL